MGEIISLFSVITMKLKSKLNESNIYFQYDIPWERFKGVKWMNEKASSNRAYIPTTVSTYFTLCTYINYGNFIIGNYSDYYNVLLIFFLYFDHNYL